MRNYFIFNIESIGQYEEPYEIAIDAAKILHDKCTAIKRMVDQLREIERAA